MRIGKHRDRIKIIKRLVKQDAGGGWTPVGGLEEFTDEYTEEYGSTGSSETYWETNAGVEAIKEKRRAEGFEINLEEGLEFTVRNRNDKTVTKFMQVVFKNKNYTIHGIIDAGYRGRELCLICKVKE